MMVINEKLWNKYQSLRSMRYADGMTIERDKQRKADVLRLHLAIFYGIPEKLEGMEEGKCILVDRPWSRYRDAE
jgi:hypothetical protein